MQSPKKLFKTFYKHVTLNKTTTIFFVVALLHSLAQGIIQSMLFTIDHQYTALLSTVIAQTNPPRTNLTYLTNDRRSADFTGFQLQMCSDIPHGQKPDPCNVIFQDTDRLSISPRETKSLPYDSSAFVQTRGEKDASGNVTSVILSLPTDSSEGSTKVANLSLQCVQVLDYPRQLLYNYRREDLSFIFYQFWLFGVSVAALIFNSVPHTLSLILARALVTAWSAYAIWRTQHVESVFKLLFIGPQTPCAFDFWPGYGKARLSAEIPDLILNCTALLLSCYLGWRLVKTYSRESFMRMGPPAHIVRIYKFFMAMFVCLQLVTIFTTVSVGVWIDQLMNTAIGRTAEHLHVYTAGVLVTILLLVPWISLGWYAVRKEHQTMMAGFMIIALIFIVGWSTMFYSVVYRWTLKEWPFILGMTIYSFMFTIAALVLGAICWFNFGKGLAQYLFAEAALAQSGFAPSVFRHDPEAASFNLSSDNGHSSEKARMPSVDEGHPMPTFYLSMH